MLNGLYFNKGYFFIKWRMGRWCNYHCEYCKRINGESPLKNEYLISSASKINKLIDEEIKENTKIALIGGEIMYYDINDIIDRLTSKYITQISITSNFSANIEKYNDFFQKCYEKGVKCPLSLSLHDTQVNYQDFLSKLNKLNVCKGGSVKVEMVITENNHDIIPFVISKCEELGFVYVFDNEQSKKNDSIVQNNIKKTNRKKVLYKAIDDNNNDLLFKSKSEVINYFGGIKPYGYWCSASMVNIEIEDNKIYNTSCSEKKIVGDIDNGFTREIIKCQSQDYCNLCGNICIDKDKTRLLNFLTQ